MRAETWGRLDEHLRDPLLRAEAVPAEEIEAASEELGMPFSADYKDFVLRYGGALVGSSPIIGLRAAELMGALEGSVVKATQHFRKDGWPGVESWAVISIDPFGNPIGLAADDSVWLSDHDSHVIEKVAESFQDYLLRCLGEAPLPGP